MKTESKATDLCIHQLFEEQARRTPNAIAAIFQQDRLSYSELNQRADDLASVLRNRGIQADVPVGICMDRSLEMLVGLLAILKAGGCYVPLDPKYPKDRLAFVLADAQPPVLLTQASLRKEFELETSNVKLICVDDPKNAFEDKNNEMVNASQSSDSLAYIIYTSGSTGKPKGVMITHRNVANLFLGMDRVLGPEPGVWLAVTSISFDISVLELFWTLARGFTVVIAADGPQAILDQIRQHGVTHFQCTPSLAGNLVRTAGAPEALGQLRKLLIGGEAFPTALAAQLRPTLQGDLLNMYGPTETTVWSATHLVQHINGTVPIGHPIANTQIYILDEQLQRVPDDQPGELYIGGDGVARGYWNRPELTAERFVADSSSRSGEGRLYRTGDIGRRRADGSFEFLGRADHQVKLHGHRIELGEIESVLGQHPAVRECVVRVWDAGPDDKRLAAYLVPVDSAAAQGLDLRRFLETKLLSHMIPAAFVWLDKMPLTPNGKVDRNALPKPDEARPNLGATYSPPRPGIESSIADIWQHILRLEKVGVHDNFFDLGGSSLLLMQAHARLCAALKADLPIVRFFEYPTIAALTQFMADRDQSPLSGVHQRAAHQREAFARRQRQAMPVTA